MVVVAFIAAFTRLWVQGGEEIRSIRETSYQQDLLVLCSRSMYTLSFLVVISFQIRSRKRRKNNNKKTVERPCSKLVLWLPDNDNPVEIKLQ